MLVSPCPTLLIFCCSQYILSYPPHLEALSSMWNPKIRHSVVAMYPLNYSGSSVFILFKWKNPIGLSRSKEFIGISDNPAPPLVCRSRLLIHIFSSNLYTWRFSLPSATRECAVPLWQRTHLSSIIQVSSTYLKGRDMIVSECPSHC
jgi:hypothetical protein